ncbi:Zona pellucida domain [Trinorchestia longiramus]|nr:Zona pellucida domain [Trinorchestia longiramus]
MFAKAWGNEGESEVEVKAKEVNGKAAAEDRSSAAFMHNSHAPPDQVAVESIDRDHSVFVPPPNLMQGPIPVPVSLAAKPGSLVLPGHPFLAQSRLPGGYEMPHHRRNFPRGPPPAVGKRPHPVRTNYAQPPSLGQVPRQRSPPFTTFYPPPPRGFGYSPVPHPFNVPPPVSRHHTQQTGPPLITPSKEPNYQPPPPPPPPSPPTSPQAASAPPPPPPPPPAHDHEGIHDGPDFGDPKNNDLLIESESSRVTYEHIPPAQNPAPLTQSAKQLDVEDYVPPSQVEERKSIVNNQDQLAVETSRSSAYIPPTALGPVEQWPSSAPDMPQIVALDVKCEKNLMKVRIEFDKPFNGIIFSKGYYSSVHCVHLPAGLGRTHSTFDISINSCGTSGNTENGLYGYGSQSGSGTYFENTIVVQYDPQVQEVWDQARKLRCTWHDQYEKSVTFRPFSVDMLDVVRADFAGDNVGCWMQIQVGKGPWASEVSGLVKIGQTMTMVLAIKEDDNKFDMMVRNCMAHDGKRAPIQLVDQRGCITRPKLMSRFTKIKDFGASASVLSYAHFQAFKFPDSMEVHFQCTIQICRYQCPEQCSDGVSHGYSGGIPSGPRDHRRKREIENSDDKSESEADKQTDIGVNRIIQVVSTRDLTFILDKNGTDAEELAEITKETLVTSSVDDHDGLICMSTPGFAATLIVLLGILIVSCLLSAFLCLKFRVAPKATSIISSYENPVFLRK